MPPDSPADQDGAQARLAGWCVVGAAAVVTLVILLDAGRGRTFFYDEWDWVQHRSTGGISTVLEAHNNHISVVPVLLFRVLFETVGFAPVGPFRAMTAVAHVLCGLVLFRLVARRVGAALGVVAAVLFLGLGAAWQATLWGQQVGLVLCVLGGLVAWNALDRDDGRHDVVAWAGLMLAVSSFLLGVLIAAGVLVELALQRRWRQLWIPLLPLGCAAIWGLFYGGADITSAGIRSAVPWAVDAAAAAAGGIVGTGLDWGRVMLVMVVAALAAGITRGGWSPRLGGVLVVAGSLWIATGAARSVPPVLEAPDASRYVEIGAPLLLLALAEAWRGVRITRHAAGRIALGLAVGACLGLGLDRLRDGERMLQSNSDDVSAVLAAIELLRAAIAPDLRPALDVAPQIVAGTYLAAVDAVGESPLGSSPTAALVRLPDGARSRADLLLIAGAVTVGSGPTTPTGPCRAATTREDLELAPGSALVVEAGATPVTVEVRRFGPAFQPQLVTIPAAETGQVVVADDPSPQPWRMRFTADAAFTVCDS